MNTTMTMAPDLPQPAMVVMPQPAMVMMSPKKAPEMLKAIPVRQPTELYDRFALAFNNGDLEAIMMLFDEAGQTVPLPGQPPVIGLPAIRAVMQQVLALRPQIRYERINVLQADAIALLNAEWRLTLRLPDSYPQEQTGKGTQVARRQPDGSWRLLIDNPWALHEA